MPDIETAVADVPRIDPANRDALASKIQSSFDSVMQNEVDDEPAEAASGGAEEPTATEEAEQPAAEATTREDAVAEAGEEKTEDATATPEAAAPAKAAAPTLPAAYVRSLKAYEWTDEEIAEAAKNPSFITTAAKLHQTRTKEVAEWAKLGRTAKEQQQPKTPETQPASTPAVLKPVDVKALKAKYGDESLIDELAGPVNAAIEQMQQMLPIVQQTQSRAQQAQLESLGRQVEAFFTAKDMEPYKETYGTAKPTEAQLAARTKVLEFADALVGGARQQGRQLSFDEALTMAHDATSGETKIQTARKQIASQLQTRQRSITMKPGARGTNVIKPGSRSELEKRVKTGLASLLG